MKKVLIIGCGLLGSSLVRRISKKKIAKKIFIYEKSKSNIAKIKKLKLPGTIVKSLKEGACNSDFIIFCTCLLYTSPSPRDRTRSRMPSSA